MSEIMNTQNILDIRTPHRFGMREVVIINLLSLVAQAIAGVFLGVGCFGILVTSLSVVNSWIVLLALFFLALSFIMFLFTPGIMFANYYVNHLVSHLRSNEGGPEYTCQIATLPRSCKGVRAFLEDADDIGILSAQSEILRFRGDHSDLTIDMSQKISVELRNIG
jgi:hypothetical protein